MKKFLIIMLSILGFQGRAQEFVDTSSASDYERVYVEAGFLQPIGKLSKQFEIAPSFGFWFRSRIEKENFVDLGFNFFIPKNPVEPNFRYRNTTVNYKSDHFAINIGTRFAKVFPISKTTENFNVDWNSGIGIALNFYSAPDELEFGDREYTEEVLTTFYLSQGIKVNYKNVGLQCHYNWSPYGLFNEKLEQGFGSHSLMFGIVYRQ